MSRAVTKSDMVAFLEDSGFSPAENMPTVWIDEIGILLQEADVALALMQNDWARVQALTGQTPKDAEAWWSRRLAFDPTALPEGWTRHPAPNYEFSATYRYTSRPLTMAYLPSGKLEVQRWVQRPHGEEYEWETEEPEGSDLVLAGRALEALGRHLERVQAEAMNKAHGWEDKR